jgi:hypothetical protein
MKAPDALISSHITHIFFRSGESSGVGTTLTLALLGMVDGWLGSGGVLDLVYTHNGYERYE